MIKTIRRWFVPLPAEFWPNQRSSHRKWKKKDHLKLTAKPKRRVSKHKLMNLHVWNPNKKLTHSSFCTGGLSARTSRGRMGVEYASCKAAFVGMRNVMTAGEPKNNPFTLPSNSKECDRRPPAWSLSHDCEVLPLTTLNISWGQWSSTRVISYAVL